jgi:hypothetical protein
MLLQFLKDRVRSQCFAPTSTLLALAGVVSPAPLAQEVIAGHSRNVSACSIREREAER